MKANDMKYPFFGTSVYWRLKGDREYKYGYPTQTDNGLVRMGRWNGDTNGTIVSLEEIEVKSD